MHFFRVPTNIIPLDFIGRYNIKNLVSFMTSRQKGWGFCFLLDRYAGLYYVSDLFTKGTDVFCKILCTYVYTKR